MCDNAGTTAPMGGRLAAFLDIVLLAGLARGDPVLGNLATHTRALSNAATSPHGDGCARAQFPMPLRESTSL